MEEGNSSIIQEEDSQGVYISDILLDKKLVHRVKNKGSLDITEKEGTKNSIFQKISRKNILYYGMMQGEQPIKIEEASINFQAPLTDINQIRKRLMTMVIDYS